MLYTPETVRDRIRSEDGKRVFYLTPGDRLTPSAREYLDHERVELRTVREDRFERYETLFGAVLTHKPEHMTQLHGNVLVFKDHPRIVFRGKLDSLQALILLCRSSADGQPVLQRELDELLTLVRRILRCEVLSEPVEAFTLGGMDEAALREHSHHPERYYGISHFMPDAGDSPLLLQLNQLRTEVRACELSAYRAFRDADGVCTREDILRAMNRLSSFVYLMMIRLKSEGGTAHE